MTTHSLLNSAFTLQVAAMEVASAPGGTVCRLTLTATPLFTPQKELFCGLTKPARIVTRKDLWTHYAPISLFHSRDICRAFVGDCYETLFGLLLIVQFVHVPAFSD